MAEQREQANKCMWCDAKDHKNSECPINSLFSIFDSVIGVIRSLQVEVRKYDIESIEESSSIAVIEDDDMCPQEISVDAVCEEVLWDNIPIVEISSSDKESCDYES